jgi:alkylhydroperoxidase/carboxymuconolactone decarboxylase family protein YurZ
MSDADMTSRARAAYEACFNGVLRLPPGDPPAGSYTDLNMRMIGETWGDQRLAIRDKRLIVLSLLIGSGADPSLFMTHARAALKNQDLTVEEIRALINFGLFYAGAKSTSLPYRKFEEFVAAEDQARV